MRSSIQLKKDSLKKLENNWLEAIIICFITYILFQGYKWNFYSVKSKIFSMDLYHYIGFNIDNIFINIALAIVSIILVGIFYKGASYFLLKIVRGNKGSFDFFLTGFKNWQKAFLTYLLMSGIIILCTMLLIIPGIIASYACSMTFYILNDYEDISPFEAIKLSFNMMRGHKFDLFCVQLSLIGWCILSLFTLGLGFIVLSPYYRTMVTEFYEDVKFDYEKTNSK